MRGKPEIIGWRVGWGGLDREFNVGRLVRRGEIAKGSLGWGGDGEAANGGDVGDL